MPNYNFFFNLSVGLGIVPLILYTYSVLYIAEVYNIIWCIICSFHTDF